MAAATGAFASVLSMVLLMPMGSIAFGLLYFRTRESTGEPLPEILSGFEEKLAVPVRPRPETTPHHTV